MASRNSESVIEQIVGGRGFVLMDKDLIGKLEIVTTFSNFIKKIENLILKGDPESAINLLRVLLDPQAVVVRGTIQKVGRLMTTATLERRMKQTLEKELMKDKGGIQKAYDTLIAIYGHLSPTDVFELSANGISFWIYEETQTGRDTEDRHQLDPVGGGLGLGRAHHDYYAAEVPLRDGEDGRPAETALRGHR